MGSDIRELLQSNQKLLEEAKIELIYEDQDSLKEWHLIQEHVRSVFRLVHRIRSLTQKDVARLFDWGLTSSLDLFINKIEMSLESLETMCDTGINIPCQNHAQALEQVNLELSRFRQRHILRQYSLEEVERFYAYMYDLSRLSEELQALESNIILINKTGEYK